MKILINDICQFVTLYNPSIAEKTRTPSLKDIANLVAPTYTASITFAASSYVDCIGVGNTDATHIDIATSGAGTIRYPITTDPILIPLTGVNVGTWPNCIIGLVAGTYIGRFAIGRMRSLKIYSKRAPGYVSTYPNRETLSGQIIASTGGINKRTFEVDIKHQIDSDILADFETQKQFLAKGLPYFVDFTEDAAFITLGNLYAQDKNEVVFQSGMARILYSKKFNFEECF